MRGRTSSHKRMTATFHHHLVCPQCRTTNRVRADQLGRGPSCGQCKQALFPGHPIVLDAAGFERHMARDEIPLLVDFWAPWCAPCKVMAPAFTQAAAELEPGMRLAQLNTEAAPELAARLSIRSIPTLAVFSRGREVARQAGALTRAADVVRWARAHVNARAHAAA